MARFTACPLCGSSHLGPLFLAGSQPVERCAACTLAFLNPQPEAEDAVLYAEAYYRGACAVKAGGQENVLEPARIARRLESCRGIVDELEGWLGGRGRWLDLGCGPGFLLKAARDAGWETAGADVSPFATRYARETFGIADVRTGPLEALEFPRAGFDVVSLQHVIEHFRDPGRMVERIRAWLRPRGLLWIETPDVDSAPARRAGPRWEHVKVPEHLFYFGERTLRRLLGARGFEVLACRREVEGTGLLTAACGGAEGARRFYEVAKRNALFRLALAAVRRANELYRGRLRGASDVIRVVARAREGAG